MIFFYRRFVAHDDPLVAGANVLAVIVASNQPAFPLYVWLITGAGAARAAVVLAAMPVFLAVPVLARRSPLAARALLPLAGIANIVLCAWSLGSEAGTEILLVACAAIAAAFLRAGERWVMLAIVAVAGAAWLIAVGHPAALFDAAGYAGLRRLNALSAIALCGLVGWLVPRR